ncbi:MAG: MFS transporter [Actinobacteria bacterium]|nr:MFS transporter [Actinomycetota bacterium]
MKDEKFQKLDVITISFAHLTHDIYSSFLAPILPLLIRKFNLSCSLVGLLRLFQRLPSLMNPFVGIIADRVSVRYFLIIAPALTTVSMSLLGCAPNYVIIAILLFVAGIGTALFHVPGPVMIKHVAGRQRVGMGMSIYMLGGELARTVGPLIILGAVSLWKLEGTYKLIPFGITASILLFFKFRNIDIKQDFKREEQRSRVGETLRNLLPFFLLLTAVTPVLMWLFITVDGFWALPILLLLGFFLFANSPVLLALVQEIGFERPAPTNGIYMTISFLLSSLTLLPIGIIADRIGLESTFKITAITAFGGIPFVLMLPKSKRKIKE